MDVKIIKIGKYCRFDDELHEITEVYVKIIDGNVFTRAKANKLGTIGYVDFDVNHALATEELTFRNVNL